MLLNRTSTGFYQYCPGSLHRAAASNTLGAAWVGGRVPPKAGSPSALPQECRVGGQGWAVGGSVWWRGAGWAASSTQAPLGITAAFSSKTFDLIARLVVFLQSTFICVLFSFLLQWIPKAEK